MIPSDLVSELLERHEIPGAAVGVLLGGEREIACFGVTSTENPLAVDEGTLFQIGSITKTFTATAVMRLLEQGRLDLDVPVRTYVPELRLADEAVAAAVTLRHLLSHTGGWDGDYFDPVGPGDDALATVCGRLDACEQLTPLGETWSYNNAGFYLAGRAIEAVTGATYERALTELVLDPLGLELSFFLPEHVLTRRFAVGHFPRGTVSRDWYIGRPAAPAGGLVSAAGDLLRYAELHLGRVEEILSADSVEAMCVPQADVGGGMGDAVGLAWFLADLGGRTLRSHGGATSGQQAFLELSPADGFAFCALTNHAHGGALNRSLRRALLRDLLGVELPELEHEQRTPAELEAYAGRYRAALLTVDLSVDDGSLRQELSYNSGFPDRSAPPPPSPPPTRLAFVGEDEVVALDPPLEGARSAFLRGPDGGIAWYRNGGRLHRRV